MKNQKNEIDNGWDCPNSVYKRIPKDGELIKVEGRYMFHSAAFEFSLTVQNRGRYPLRGTVRALASTGETLKLRGEAKKRVLASLPEDKRSDSHRKLTVATNVHCNSKSEDEIKSCIIKAVSRLYDVNKELIGSQVEASARPDTITPNIAAQLKAASYVAYKHDRASDEERKRLIRRVRNCCAKLPSKAMADIKKTELREWFEKYQIGKEEQKELYKFWEFCCDRGICAGTNPVDLPKKTRNSYVLNQIKQKRLDELNLEMLDCLYKLLYPVTDISAGIALMVSGFDPRFICELKWRDIVFHKPDDFVVVRYMKDDGESATKNYSRPLVPRSALILREHYNNILAENEGSDLNGMFVIRNRQSKTKAFGHQYLIQEATRLINQVGISYSTINAMTKEDRSFAAARKILLNTYKRCILEYCRMNEDIGTANFLLGQSFKTDTTSSSYTSFTAPEAERRLYSIMRILAEDRPLKKKKEVIPRDGIQAYNFGPERTTAFTGVSGKMILPKGCELVIKCPHGVQGYVRAVDEEK